MARGRLEAPDSVLARLAQDAGDIVFMHDLAGRLLWANGAALRALGYTESDVGGLLLRELVHADSMPAFERGMRRLAAGLARRSGPYAMRLVQRGGGTIWVEVLSTVMEGDGGAPVVQGIGRVLDSRQDGWDAFAEMAPLGMLRMDSAGRIAAANPAAARTLGRACATGAPVRGLLEDPDAWDDAVKAAQAADGSARFDAALAAPGGGWTRWHLAADRAGTVHAVVESVRTPRTVALGGEDAAALADDLAQAPDLEAGLGLLVAGLCRLAGWSYGEAWVEGDRAGRLRASEAWWCKDPRMLGRLRRLSQQLELHVGEGPVGAAWSRRRVVPVPDVRQEPGFPLASVARAVGLVQGMTVPVVAGARTVAVLLFLSGPDGPVDEQWGAVAGTLGAHLGAMVGQRAHDGGLRQRARLLQGMLDAAPDPAAVLAHDGSVLAVNDALMRLAGTRRISARGHDALACVDRPQRLRDAVAALYEGSLTAAGHVAYAGRVFERRQQRILDEDDLPLGLALWWRDVTHAGDSAMSRA